MRNPAPFTEQDAEMVMELGRRAAVAIAGTLPRRRSCYHLGMPPSRLALLASLLLVPLPPGREADQVQSFGHTGGAGPSRRRIV